MLAIRLVIIIPRQVSLYSPGSPGIPGMSHHAQPFVFICGACAVPALCLCDPGCSRDWPDSLGMSSFLLSINWESARAQNILAAGTASHTACTVLKYWNGSLPPQLKHCLHTSWHSPLCRVLAHRHSRVLESSSLRPFGSAQILGCEILDPVYITFFRVFLLEKVLFNNIMLQWIVF